MSEIYILCNSHSCLEEISSGQFTDLQTKDIVTCNNAYGFFNTSGRHLNMMGDYEMILEYVLLTPIMTSTELVYRYKKNVEFVFSLFNMTHNNGNIMFRYLPYSTVKHGATTGLFALAHLCAVEKYDTIYFIGYTLDEKENKIWDDILLKYTEERIRANVFKYTRK